MPERSKELEPPVAEVPRRPNRRRALAERLKRRWFDEREHPYVHLERAIERHVAPGATLLELGCGRDAEVLRRFRGRGCELVGVDLGEFSERVRAADLRLVQADAASTGLPDASVDAAFSRALMEHVEDPESLLCELRRVLKPGGRYVFLAPNLGDYASILAYLVPNRWHARIVRLTEGRPERDTFPAYFRCNTRRSIRRHCERAGLELESLEHLGQYPSYFLFDPLLFALASGYEKLISRFRALRSLRGWLLVVLRRPAGD